MKTLFAALGGFLAGVALVIVAFALLIVVLA